MFSVEDFALGNPHLPSLLLLPWPGRFPGLILCHGEHRARERGRLRRARRDYDIKIYDIKA